MNTNQSVIGDFHVQQMATVSLYLWHRHQLDFLSIRFYVAPVYVNVLHDAIERKPIAAK